MTITLGGGPDDGAAGEGDDVGTDVEGVEGGAVQDTLTGDDTANALDGGSGADFVDGARGSDTLSGGSAPDVVRSRDGLPDQVSYGSGRDLAIADPLDTVRDCEAVDRGGRRTLRPGGKLEVDPTAGTVGIRLAGAGRWVPLRDDTVIPEGASLDATKGELRLAFAVDGAGKRRGGTFYGGAFTIHHRTRALTELKLRGGDFSGCGARSFKAAQKREVRSLWGRSKKARKGRFRTRGRWSSATIRGTIWLVEDGCDGTLTRVGRGVVVVHDDVRNRDVTVRAGESYLAPAPGR